MRAFAGFVVAVVLKFFCVLRFLAALGFIELALFVTEHDDELDDTSTSITEEHDDETCIGSPLLERLGPAATELIIDIKSLSLERT